MSILEGVEHVEGSEEYKWLSAEGDWPKLAAILNVQKALTRAATEMNDLAEVDRVIAEQERAFEAERELNELADRSM